MYVMLCYVGVSAFSCGFFERSSFSRTPPTDPTDPHRPTDNTNAPGHSPPTPPPHAPRGRGRDARLHRHAAASEPADACPVATVVVVVFDAAARGGNAVHVVQVARLVALVVFSRLGEA